MNQQERAVIGIRGWECLREIGRKSAARFCAIWPINPREISEDCGGQPMNLDLAVDAERLKSINPAILVEGEIGWIGASSAILEKASEGVGVLTTPEEAKQFVDATNIDVLAPAVGNMHGLLQSMVHGEAQTRLDV